jgi:hypothetical protein
MAAFLLVGDTWVSIDMRRVIESLHIPIFANDSGADQDAGTTGDNQRFEVEWNYGINAYVTKNGPALVYDRSALIANADGHTPSYWKAFETGKSVEQMEKVLFVKKINSVIFNSWMNISQTKKWNFLTQTWENL